MERHYGGFLVEMVSEIEFGGERKYNFLQVEGRRFRRMLGKRANLCRMGV